jgi:hypothetical protein
LYEPSNNVDVCTNDKYSVVTLDFIIKDKLTFVLEPLGIKLYNKDIEFIGDSTTDLV